jgi:hypothetical protein
MPAGRLSRATGQTLPHVQLPARLFCGPALDYEFSHRSTRIDTDQARTETFSMYHFPFFISHLVAES